MLFVVVTTLNRHLFQTSHTRNPPRQSLLLYLFLYFFIYPFLSRQIHHRSRGDTNRPFVTRAITNQRRRRIAIYIEYVYEFTLLLRCYTHIILEYRITSIQVSIQKSVVFSQARRMGLPSWRDPSRLGIYSMFISTVTSGWANRCCTGMGNISTLQQVDPTRDDVTSYSGVGMSMSREKKAHTQGT